MTDLNDAGRANARTLITHGKVDKTADWSFSAEDGAKVLGSPATDWAAYGKIHLGVDPSAAADTEARFKYPFAKEGKVFRSALIAIRQRASQQHDEDIFAAAGGLLEQIDGEDSAKSSGLFECKVAPFEFKFTEENGTKLGQFEGYGSVFNVLDDHKDVMEPGAFDATLAQAKAKGRMPKMLLNHGGLAPGMSATPHDLLPIGSWKAMSPDTAGLQTKGQLINLDTESGKRIYGAMKERELNDMSIGYTARSFQRGFKAGDPKRRLKAVDLHELSVVTFGSNPYANISAVKSMSFTAHDMRDLEAALREGGLSRSEALKGIAVFKSFLQRDAADPEPELRDAATSDDLRALAERIRASAA